MYSYLSEKNFLYLYLYKMFYRGSTAPVHIFTGTGLVAMGASISSVIFFYALTILTLGLMSPVGVFVMDRYSVKIAAMSAVMFRLLFFVCLLLVERGQHDLLWLGAFFTSVWQMTYAFFEVFSLLGLALVYYYFGLTVFTVSFTMLAFGGLLNYYNFSENKEKQRNMLLDGA